MKLLDRVKRSAPLLQVALDVVRLEDALRIAVMVSEFSDKVVVEAGTPLVKSEGLRAVSILGSATGLPVVADTKTVDVVGLEAKLAAEAGASAYTVMGFVHDAVVKAALEASEEHGLDVFFDTMYLEPVGAVKRLVSLGVRAVEVHVGIDMQRALNMTAEQLIDSIRVIKRDWPDLVVAVAGGINEKTAGRIVDAGADIVVVGSAIVKARDPREAARRILASMGV